jgi:hypothetical protein
MRAGGGQNARRRRAKMPASGGQNQNARRRRAKMRDGGGHMVGKASTLGDANTIALLSRVLLTRERQIV